VPERPCLVLLTPLAPARTGNGLAMRAATLLDAALVDHRVHLVIVPLAGEVRSVDDVRLASIEVAPLADVGDPVALAAIVADPRWRERWSRLDPPPAAVLAAPPTLAAALADRLRGEAVRGVVALRLTLGPVGLALAEALEVPLVIDADDDDERLQHDLGHDRLADAMERVASVCLPAARAVLAASAEDADALSRRHHLDPPAAVSPNAAPLPTRPVGPPPGDGRTLFVANFTYEPNALAARWLVNEVVPHLAPEVTVDLVGAAGEDLRGLAGARVRVHGPVDGLSEHYAAADVAVAPLRHGAGSRIKVLEAFAHGRPVVATTVGVAGLDVEPGRHVLVADDPAGFAASILDARRPDTARAFVAGAADLVERRYAPEVVVPALAQRLRAVLDL
jgi:hypothetical protein